MMATKSQLPHSFRIANLPNSPVCENRFKLAGYKSLTKLGATGFEPATSWSRTKISISPRSEKTLENIEFSADGNMVNDGMHLTSIHFRFHFVSTNIPLSIFGEDVLQGGM